MRPVQAIGDALGDHPGRQLRHVHHLRRRRPQLGPGGRAGLADKLVWVLVVLTPLAIAATLAISARRRRTLLQLTVGIALSMVLVRRLVFLFQKDLLELRAHRAQHPGGRGDQRRLPRPPATGALWIGIGALRDRRHRRGHRALPVGGSAAEGTVGAARTVGAAITNGAEDQETIEWVGRQPRPPPHRRRRRSVWSLLWWLDLSWLGFFLLAALVGGYELRGAPDGRAGHRRSSPSRPTRSPEPTGPQAAPARARGRTSVTVPASIDSAGRGWAVYHRP